MCKINANLQHIKTNPDFCIDEIRVSYKGVRVRVGRQTGNWHPDGKPWLASIGADIHNYGNPDKWAMGLGGWGATRDEAVANAMEYAKSQTLRFPPAWLGEVMKAIDYEYQIR